MNCGTVMPHTALSEGPTTSHSAGDGHKSLETTMGYLHADSLNIRSPLEVLEANMLSEFES